MRDAAQAQFDAGCDVPTVTLDVSFINCAETEEYKEYGFLQNIFLGDAVRVIAPRVGVWVSMRMTQYTYDCLTRKYTKMTLGTVADSATLVTRKTNVSSNGSSNSAAQEFYEAGTNNVGIICFTGINLANKVIQEIYFTITAKKAGYGEGSTKTVYLRKANYQNSITSGVTGSGYAGDALGTFTGHFYGNTSAYQLAGTLYNAVASYLAAGNNTFTIYNPSPSASAHGYSYNYLSWSDVVITVTYETTEDYALVRERIAQLLEGNSERLVTCAGILTGYLDQGKTELTVLDICEAMNLDIDTAGNVISQLKTKGILKSARRGEKVMIYAFCKAEEPEPEMENRDAFRETLTQQIGNGRSLISKAMMILLKYLNDGKDTFSSLEFQQELGFDNEQTYRVCYQLKGKGLIILTGYENDRPNYALAFQENEAAHCEPVKPGDMHKNAANHYRVANAGDC